MSDGNTKGKKKNWIYFLAVVIVFALAVAAAFIWFFEGKSDGHEDKSSVPVIELSVNTASVPLGGNGEVTAKLLYPDGHIEDSRFMFESSRPELLEFENSMSGNFTVNSTYNSSEFSLGDEVTVTVRCTYIEGCSPAQLDISIVDSEKHGITFEYYDTNFGTEMQRAEVKLYDGETPREDAEYPATALVPSYTFEGWYIVENGQYTDRVFNSADRFYYDNWGYDLTVRARYKAELQLDADNDGMADSSVGDVYYGEPLPTEILETLEKGDVKPPESLGDGWEFKGWYTDIEDGHEIGADKDREFYGAPVLRAKWQTEIKLNYLFAVKDAVETLSVVYGVTPEYPSANDVTYLNSGVFEGWYYFDGGEEKRVETGVPFILAADTVLHAKVKFAVQFSDMGKIIDVGEQKYIVYGENFTYLYHESEWPDLSNEDEWSFAGWRTGEGGSGESFTSATEYVTAAPLMLYSVRTSSLVLYYELDEDGASQHSELLDIVYGAEPNLPVLQQTSAGWSFEGWYTSRGGEGEQIYAVEAYTGNAGIPLYAKWTGTPSFNLTEVLDNGIDSVGGTVVGHLASNVFTRVTYFGTVDFGEELIPTYNDGGRFGGWYTDSYGGGTQITDGSGKGLYSVAQLELYDKILFTVTVDYNDATEYNEELTDFDVTYGMLINIVDYGITTDPVKAGWNFSGWLIQYRAGQYDLPADEPYSLLSNISLQAQWEWSITLDPYINSPDLASVRVTFAYGENINFGSLENWGDWSFAGWFTKPAGEVQDDEIDNIRQFIRTSDYQGTGESILYAHWVLERVTLHSLSEDTIVGYEVYDRVDNILYGRSINDALAILDKDISSPAVIRGYVSGKGWYNGFGSDASLISFDQDTYPAFMANLYYQCTPATYTVRLDNNTQEQVTGEYTGEITATIGQQLPDLSNYVPQRTGITFLGYYYDDQSKVYYNSNMVGVNVWDIVPTSGMIVTLKASWGTPWDVTLDPVIEINLLYSDSNGSEAIRVCAGAAMPSGESAPVRAGYRFEGYFTGRNGTGTQYYDENMSSTNAWAPSTLPGSGSEMTATLYAYWTVIDISVSASSSGNLSKLGDSNQTITVTVSGGSGRWTYTVSDNQSAVEFSGITNATITDSSTTFNVKKKNHKAKGSFTITVTNERTEIEYTTSLSYHTTDDTTDGGGCFTQGSLITLADGTTKKVEDLVSGEEIMVFNHSTGKIDSAPVIYIFHDGYKEYEVLNLYFSDGTEINVLFGHGFFDRKLNEYVVITPENVDEFIGHSFIKVNTDGGVAQTCVVELTSYTVTYEYTECYSVVSAIDINHIVNGLLAVTDDIEGLYNIFELDSNMKYDCGKMQSDIEKYGLFTYEEWADYVTYEEFVAFNGAYLKVAIGKGLTSYEQIISLIDRFLS